MTGPRVAGYDVSLNATSALFNLYTKGLSEMSQYYFLLRPLTILSAHQHNIYTVCISRPWALVLELNDESGKLRHCTTVTAAAVAAMGLGVFVAWEAPLVHLATPVNVCRRFFSGQDFTFAVWRATSVVLGGTGLGQQYTSNIQAATAATRRHLGVLKPFRHVVMH